MNGPSMPKGHSGIVRVSVAFACASLTVLAVSIALGFDAIVSLISAFVITPIVGGLILSRSNDAR
jgi:hypothetical protein